MGESGAYFDLVINLSGEAEVTFAKADSKNYLILHIASSSVRLGRVLAGLEEELAGTALKRAIRQLVLKRRGVVLRVIANGKCILTAYDSELLEGKVELVRGKTKLRLRTVKPVAFYDDFMRKEIGSMWEEISGEWELRSVRNPARSTNAFRYVGSSERGFALSLAGYEFWDEYSASVRATGAEGAQYGLAFYASNSENYFALLWTGEELELLRAEPEKTRVLSRAPFHLNPNTWYEFKVEVSGNKVRGYIDGNELLSASSNELVGGRVGLIVRGEATFDDLAVQSGTFYEEDFKNWSRNRAVAIGGKWGISSACKLKTAKEAKLIFGNEDWMDYQVSVLVNYVKGGAVGCVFYYLDELTYGIARWFPRSGDVEIWKVTDGKRVLLAKGHAERKSEGGNLLTVSLEKGLIRLSINDREAVAGWDTSLQMGRAGLYGYDTKAQFTKFRVDFGKELAPVLTSPTVFAHEKTMANWAAPASDWRKDSTSGISWHRLKFFGDLRIELEPPEELSEGAKLALLLGQDSTPVYRVELTRKELSLWERGKLLERRPLSGIPPCLLLIRAGELVVGGVEDGPSFSLRDREAKTLRSVGYLNENIELDPQTISLFASNIEAYTFEKAFSEWRVNCGEWQVSNRWACDPRWSWLNGRQKDGPAVIWSKKSFSGDMVVDFCVGVRMEPKWGSGYTYVRDFNLTIGGDGKDIVSGYSFIFGGWENTATAILYGKELLAKNEKLLIKRGGLHRRWYYIKVVKKGNKLEYWIDDKLELSARLKQPLKAGKIAIWTYDDSIMVARVRVCAEKISPPEKPVAYKGSLTPYD